MLSLQGIKKSFGHHQILRGISFDAQSGILTILEGQNGSGKSTLFNILSGTLVQDEGKILLDNSDIGLMPAIERATFMAVLKQDPKASSSASLTVMENCALALLKSRNAQLSFALRASIKEKILAHLKSIELDVASLLDRQMGELSGGQRQILAFAMATMDKPQLLLLDEPTAALDDKSSHLLMRLIKRLVAQWQIPALMISHDHGLNESYGDEVKVLVDGVVT